jgi:hypothetical protein
MPRKSYGYKKLRCLIVQVKIDGEAESGEKSSAVSVIFSITAKYDGPCWANNNMHS